MGSLKGAAGGAMTGAAAGAALGPWGAAAGGVIGGALGYFSGGDEEPAGGKLQHYDAATGQLLGMAQSAQGRYAPTISASELGRQYIDQSRGGMMDTAGRLGSIANGQQAGAGELAVNRQVGAATAGQLGAARMARGANAALAYRNAMRNTSDIGLAGAGQAAQAQMQDQSNANAQLGQIYGSMYGLDAGVAGQNAQLAQQAALANQGAQMTQQQLNDAREQAALAQLLGWDSGNNGSNLGWAQYNAAQPNVGAGIMQGAGQLALAYANNQNRQPTPAPMPSAPQDGGITSPGGGSTFGQYQRPAF